MVLNWANGLAGSGNEEASTLTFDLQGNLIITGAFQNTLDFDPGLGTAELTSTWINDLFIAKYDNAGNYIFAKQLGGRGGGGTTSAIIDEVGNLYLTGYFTDSVDFDPSSNTAFLVSGEYNNGFIAKYDSNGNYLFAYSYHTNESQVNSIDLDESGNIYVTGYFHGTVDFDPGNNTASLSSFGSSDTFIAKYDSDGNYIYVRRIGGTNGQNGLSIIVDDFGGVYLMGGFHGITDFDPSVGIANLTSEYIGAAFVAKYDTNGEYIFAKGITPSVTVYDMAMDHLGNLYLTGSFVGAPDFDPSSDTTALVSAPSLDGWGSRDAFIAKYDVDGNYIYVKSITGQGYESGNSLALDDMANVYLTGEFSETADFDPDIGSELLTSEGDMDIFVAKYDSDGNYLYAKAMGGTHGTYAQGGRVIATDGIGSVYVTGNYSRDVDLDPGLGIYQLEGPYGWEIFLARYDEGFTGIQETSDKHLNVYVSEGSLNAKCRRCSGKVSVEIHDISGRIIFEEETRLFNDGLITIPIGRFSKGIYTLSVNDVGIRYATKFVL